MGAAAGPDIIEDDLIFAFDPADIKSFGRTTSSPLIDIIGKRSFTNYNSASFSSLKRGFRTTTNEFFSNTTTSFTMPNEYTFSIWFKPFDIINTQVLFTIGGWSSTHALVVYINNSRIIAYPEAQQFATSEGPFLYVNSWQNITLSRGGSYFRWYINDQLVSSLPASSSYPPYTTTGIYISNLGQNYSFQANATFGPIRIYNRVLSQEEIKQNYQSVRNRFSY